MLSMSCGQHLFESQWLFFHINIVKIMDSGERGMKPVAMTIINPWKECWPSRGLNSRPSILKFCKLPIELWGLKFGSTSFMTVLHKPILFLTCHSVFSCLLFIELNLEIMNQYTGCDCSIVNGYFSLTSVSFFFFFVQYPGFALSIATVAKCDKKINVAQDFFIWRKCVATTFCRVT